MRAIGAAVTVLIVLTCAVVVDGGPLPGDLWFVEAAQRLGGPVPTIADAIRLVTSTEACIVAFLPLVVWLARRRPPTTTISVVVIAALAMLVVQPGGKQLVDRPRPSEDLVDVRADYSSKSYPSGHSLSTTTTWGAAGGYAWRTGRRRLAAGLWAPVLLTGLSSSVQGVHWPSDAVAGTLIGGLAAWLIVRTLAGGRR